MLNRHLSGLMKRNLFGMMLALYFLAGLAQGHPVDVINPSFENPVLPVGAWTPYTKEAAQQSIPGWQTASGMDGVQNALVSYGDAVADGANFAFNDGGVISQTVGGLQAGTYTLTVAVGFRPGDGRKFAPGELLLVAGDTVLKSFPLTEPKQGTFQDETLTYTATPSDPKLGAPLTIKLIGKGDQNGGGTVDFDHVRLDFTGEAPASLDAIHSVTVCEPFLLASPGTQSGGDTWAPAWAEDGTVYSPANDTGGFNNIFSSNINFNRIDGATVDTLMGTTVNPMVPYGRGSEGGPDGCTWKSGGCLALDGVLYWTIARHKYGETSGDAFKRQPGHDGSIIKSTDKGIHWTRPAQENYDHPMFPGGRFAAGYFVNYGQDGHLAVADQSDKYVYSTANNGFWDNGDDVILGRVLRSKLPDLSGTDWQFYTGGDGAFSSSWDSDFNKAAKIIDDKDHCGETGAVYLPKQKCYLMIEWFYPAGGGKLPDACTKTTWNFLTAAHPWGPWKSVGTHDFSPQGYYCPEICPKFTSADGSKLYVFTAGNWNNGAVYRLTVVPITIQ
jgi:hypothetical protein